MPVYCYTNKDRSVLVEKVFPMSRIPKRIKHDGMVLSRDFIAEQNASLRNRPTGAGWPLECIASGVHPQQAGELRDYLKKHGVPTEVSADGNPIYRDSRHRQKALAVRGMFDRAAFN